MSKKKLPIGEANFDGIFALVVGAAGGPTPTELIMGAGQACEDAACEIDAVFLTGKIEEKDATLCRTCKARLALLRIVREGFEATITKRRAASGKPPALPRKRS